MIRLEGSEIADTEPRLARPNPVVRQELLDAPWEEA
jgi:hypothetical protein